MADDDWAPAHPSALAEVTGSGPRPAPAVEVPGYTDLREVARGGDSIVYRARQLSVDRDVAIKVIQITDPADAARFQRELEITVRLGRQHPHIVTVLDTTTASGGEPCLVMEFHDLGSLHDRLREAGPLPVSDGVAAGTAVADALAFAHSHGVLHRDVKPQNVLVLPTSYVLSDFGIARMADAGHTATLERFSYRHASPQVLDGLSPTEADDVWSLGSTLFTLLDGRAPFASSEPGEDTALSYLRRVRTDQRRLLQRDDVPDELAQLLADCLVHDRDARLGSAREALRRLRRIRTEDRSWDPEPPPVPEAEDSTRPRPAIAAPQPSPSPEPADPPPRMPAPAPEPASASSPDDAWAPGAAASAVPSRSAGRAAPSTGDDEGDDGGAPVIAPSVFAHVPVAASPAPRRSAEAEPLDDDHTGLAPDDEESEDASRRRRDEPRESSTGRRVAAFFGGVLLVGAAIGVGSALLNGADGDETPSPDPDTGSVPEETDPIPTDGPLNVPASDPALAPRQLAIDGDRGTAVDLSWTEPESEVRLYVVISVDDPENPQQGTAVGNVQPPLTQTTIEGLGVDGSDCFAVLGLVDGSGAAGISNIVCR